MSGHHLLVQSFINRFSFGMEEVVRRRSSALSRAARTAFWIAKIEEGEGSHENEEATCPNPL